MTGASRGIGRATVLRLAARGWNVVAGVRRPEDGEALSAAARGRITIVELDVTAQRAGRDAVDGARVDAFVQREPDWGKDRRSPPAQPPDRSPDGTSGGSKTKPQTTDGPGRSGTMRKLWVRLHREMIRWPDRVAAPRPRRDADSRGITARTGSGRPRSRCWARSEFPASRRGATSRRRWICSETRHRQACRRSRWPRSRTPL